MPELPEVETVRRGLTQLTLQAEIERVEVLLDRTVAYPDSLAFGQGLVGTTIVAWHRRGKYLLGQLDRQGSPGGHLGGHLRMTGQLLWVNAESPLAKHTRVRLWVKGNQELRFVDTRSFGQMWWVPADRPPEAVMTTLQTLGPEPLESEFSLGYFVDRLNRSQRIIKTALLDQRLVAGVGNIYADESLFLSGIHPEQRCHQLNALAIAALHRSLIQVLQDSIGAGGTTFSDFRDLKGLNGNYGGQAWVYGRRGEACRHCGTTIDRLKLGGRSSHFCPSCQIAPKG
jgi:formamidopyrimidine-DNA glycosylase